MDRKNRARSLLAGGLWAAMVIHASPAWTAVDLPPQVLVGPGDVIVAGTHAPSLRGEVMLLKYDRAGVLLWKRTWNPRHESRALSVTRAGDRIVVTGTTRQLRGLGDRFVLIYSRAGALLGAGLVVVFLRRRAGPALVGRGAASPAGRGASARRSARKAGSSPTEDRVAPSYRKGVQCLRRQDVAGAKAAFAETLDADADHVDAALELLRISLDQGDRAQINSCADRAILNCHRAGAQAAICKLIADIRARGVDLELGEQPLLNAARAFAGDDPSQAVDLYQRFSVQYPKTRLAAKALLEAGRLLLERLDEPDEAETILVRITAGWPDTVFAEEAERLITTAREG